MALDLATVKKIARLARIKIAPAEAEKLKDELNRTLAFAGEMDKADVTGVAPMTSVLPMRLRLREDKVTDGDKAEAVLANAPMRDEGFFLVPKVME